MSQLWVVTVPCGKENASTVCQTLQLNVANCRFFQFQYPNLVIGTLDSLMNLSDEMIKITTYVENVVRKVERQYNEIGGANQVLQINSSSVEGYLRKFDWDYAHFQHSGRQLSEIVTQIQTAAVKVDEELKKLSTALNEKSVQYSNLQRRKIINLQTSDFEDFLTPETVARLDFLKADGDKVLESVLIVCPKALEQDFLRTYAGIGKEIVKYDSGVGSPVVPDSERKVLEDNDNILYSIVIIKHHYKAGKYEGDDFIAGEYEDYLEPLKLAFREKRFTLREFVYDGNKPSGIDGQIEKAKQQLEQTTSAVTRWCQTHFGEVFVGLTHLKIIRAYIESILRYGLPVNLAAMFVEPNMQKEKQCRASLLGAISQMRPDLLKKAFEADEEDQDGDEADTLPFVCHRFTVIGGSEKLA